MNRIVTLSVILMRTHYSYSKPNVALCNVIDMRLANEMSGFTTHFISFTFFSDEWKTIGMFVRWIYDFCTLQLEVEWQFWQIPIYMTHRRRHGSIIIILQVFSSMPGILCIFSMAYIFLIIICRLWLNFNHWSPSNEVIIKRKTFSFLLTVRSDFFFILFVRPLCDMNPRETKNTLNVFM